MLKISIISCSFYVIYSNLKQNPALHFKQTLTILFPNSFTTFIWLALICLFSVFNWGLEIFKWKTLAKTIKATSFTTAAKEVLSSHTTALFTPNRIGEYGAKALFYFSKERAKIMTLNAIGNLNQMAVTICFGSIGLLYFISQFPIELNFISSPTNLFFIGILGVGFFFLMFKYPQFYKGFTVKLKTHLNSLSSNLLLKIFGISALRYFVFSTQFYLVLQWFQVEISYIHYITTISSMYLLASILPGLLIFDVVLKGGIAVYLFSFYHVSDATILSTTFILWIFNTVFPCLIGAVFVLNYKLPETT
ncbi:hypothetical protein [Formosa sp. S-31]|uniref:hypothetical protein n=1 Tax=Formosa sp. S-31 TaxID=2790949 RepID=UPI003EBD496E